MKNIKHIKDICSCDGGKDVIYTAQNGVFVRDVLIDAGLGEEILIGNISDVHINYCNKKDFDENDPVLMSSYANRTWCAKASSVPNLQRCMELLDDANAIVVNGDTLDYLSHGATELMQREIWDKFPDIIATVGGHDSAKRMEGKVPENTTEIERLKLLEKHWKHDIYYHSRLIKDKVLIIGFYNSLGACNEEQTEKLKIDLQRARKNNYIILMFAHEPIATKNPKHTNFTSDMVMTQGDISGFPYDFCNGKTKGGKLLGNAECEGAALRFYELITQNADIIKGFFSAHLHNDIHLDIFGSTQDGKEAVIPQYVTTATAYDDGHMMRILVR